MTCISAVLTLAPLLPARSSARVRSSVESDARRALEEAVPEPRRGAAGEVARINVKSDKVEGASLSPSAEKLARQVFWAEFELYRFAQRILAAEAQFPGLVPKGP